MATETAGTVANGIDCVCYLAKDFSRATSFYETRLGLKPSRGAESWVEYDLSDGTTFSIVQLPEGAWYQTGGAMFAVPDVPAAVAALHAAGVAIHGDVYDSPVCTMAWCDDTEGNNFAVHKRK